MTHPIPDRRVGGRRYRTALRLYERLHAACTAALGEHHETTLAMLVGLGVAAGLHGEYDRALRLIQRAWELISERQGETSPDTLIALDNVGVAWGDVGDHERAAGVHREVYRARRGTDGLYATGTIAHAHAALNQVDHQLEEAWALINDSLEGLRQELGSDAPATRVAQRLHDWIAGLDEMGD